MKILLGVLIFLFFVLLGGAYAVNQDTFTLTDSDPLTSADVPTVSPTVIPTVVIPSDIDGDWIPYTSEAHGFSIKHPLDVEHDMTSEGERFLKLGPTQSLGTELFDGISIMIKSGDRGNQSFDAFVRSKYQATKNEPVQPQVGELRRVTIAGKQGWAYSVSSLGERTVIYLPKGEDGYLEIMDGTVEPTNREQTFRQTVDTMLASLTFE